MGFVAEMFAGGGGDLSKVIQQPSTFIPATQQFDPEMMRQMMLTNMSSIEGREPGDVAGPMPSTTQSAALMTNRPRVTPKGYRL